MTKDTCKIYYEKYKRENNQEQMEFWKNRFIQKGGDVSELGEEEIEKKGEKKRGK